MIIAISGTPGTGKSAAATALAKRLRARLIRINSLIKAGKIPYTVDRKRKTKVIGIKDLQKAVNRIIKKAGAPVIIEGHLSHLLKTDVVFVLRTVPRALEKRLKAKKWAKEKISENVEAEAIGVITAEAVQQQKRFGNKIFEIDTTDRSAMQSAALMEKVLNNVRLHKIYRPGKIDWLERYKRGK